MKKAFTLAEVLITLGIIGVVAALTMPTLINKTQGAQYKAAFKKSLSALSQAAALNKELDGWNFDDIEQDAYYYEEYPADGPYITGFKELNAKQGLKALCTKRMKVAKTEFNNWELANSYVPERQDNYETKRYFPTDVPTFIYFTDGTAIFYDAYIPGYWDSNKNISIRRIFIDVNGKKGPNKEVKCDEPYTEGGNCVVSNPTDVYPVNLVGNVALPASPAAKAVLYGK